MLRSSARPFLFKLLQIVRAFTTMAVATLGRGVTEGEMKKSQSVGAPRRGSDGNWRSAWSTSCRSAGKSSRGRKALRIVMAMLVICSTQAVAETSVVNRTARRLEEVVNDEGGGSSPAWWLAFHAITTAASGAACCVLPNLMVPGGGGGSGGSWRRPPAWGPEMESRYPFRFWSRDLLNWAILNNDLTPPRQAAAVLGELRGGAQEFAREIPPNIIIQGGMVDGIHVDPLTYVVTHLADRFAVLGEESRLAAMTELIDVLAPAKRDDRPAVVAI